MSLFTRALSRARPFHPVPINQSIAKRYYKLSVQSIKRGQIVQLKDKAWRVLNRDSSSSGRGGAVVKVL